MFEGIIKFFKGLGKNDKEAKSKDAAKERLHLVLMQDRANISADFLALMKQEIIEVIKKYIDVDENAIDVRLTNKTNDDGTTGAPVLYANIPIVSVKEEAKEVARKEEKKQEEKKEEAVKQEDYKESNKKEEKKETQEEVKQQDMPNETTEVPEEQKEKETNEVIEKAEEIVEEIKETEKKAETVSDKQ